MRIMVTGLSEPGVCARILSCFSSEVKTRFLRVRGSEACRAGGYTTYKELNADGPHASVSP